MKSEKEKSMVRFIGKMNHKVLQCTQTVYFHLEDLVFFICMHYTARNLGALQKN